MSLIKKNSTYLVVIIFLCLSCGSKSDSISTIYYKKNVNDWSTYFRNLGAERVQLKNTIFLVLKGSECRSSIAELHWWNNYKRQNSRLNIKLVILERYATSFRAFLDYEDIEIPAIRDSSSILFDLNLLPRTPMKVYINEKGQVQFIESIGDDINPNQDSFIQRL